MTQRQKLFICIGIACFLLLTVIAAILLAAAEEQPERGAHFVSSAVAFAATHAGNGVLP